MNDPPGKLVPLDSINLTQQAFFQCTSDNHKREKTSPSRSQQSFTRILFSRGKSYEAKLATTRRKESFSVRRSVIFIAKSSISLAAAAWCKPTAMINRVTTSCYFSSLFFFYTAKIVIFIMHLVYIFEDHILTKKTFGIFIIDV